MNGRVEVPQRVARVNRPLRSSNTAFAAAWCVKQRGFRVQAGASDVTNQAERESAEQLSTEMYRAPRHGIQRAAIAA